MMCLSYAPTSIKEVGSINDNNILQLRGLVHSTQSQPQQDGYTLA